MTYQNSWQSENLLCQDYKERGNDFLQENNVTKNEHGSNEVLAQEGSKEMTQESVQQMYGINFYEELSRLILHDIKKKSKNSFFQKYSKEDIIRFLANPSANADKLIDISNYLYTSSLHYRRLIQYFARMATFDHVVVPYNMDEKKIKKDIFMNNYKKSIEYLETMNLKHEFQKIMVTVFKDDVFYGYIHETKDSFYVQKLGHKQCRIASIEDGVFNFEFDMSYFDTTPGLVDTYAEEFRMKYRAYKNAKNNANARWQALDGDNTICIKFNEDTMYPTPPFAGLFGALVDIDFFKALSKAKEELGSYKMIVMRIPLNEKSEKHNDFQIDGDTAMKYYKMASASINENIGVILSPMDVDQIDFKKDTADTDIVENITRDFYSESGVSQFLFNSKNASGISLEKSIKNDEMIVFAILRQFERWVNRKLKRNNTAIYKFKVKILDATYYNKKELIEEYLKAAQFGLPVKLLVASLFNFTPSDTMGIEFLENDILTLVDKWVPLKSSHVGGSDGEGKNGRPQSDTDDLGDEGENTRENEGNDR